VESPSPMPILLSHATRGSSILPFVFNFIPSRIIAFSFFSLTHFLEGVPLIGKVAGPFTPSRKQWPPPSPPPLLTVFTPFESLKRLHANTFLSITSRRSPFCPPTPLQVFHFFNFFFSQWTTSLLTLERLLLGPPLFPSPSPAMKELIIFPDHFPPFFLLLGTSPPWPHVQFNEGYRKLFRHQASFFSFFGSLFLSTVRIDLFLPDCPSNSF